MPIYVGDITNGRRGTVLQSTGSTWFGNSADDSHNMQGTLYLTGAIHAYMGMSGSHTKTFSGTSYLVAGSNVTITSASNGQITIASSGGSGSPAGSDTNLQYNNGGSFGGASRLLYDDTNGRLGIGVTPSTTLHVYADASSAYVTTIDNDASSAGHGLKVTSDGTGSGTHIFDVESASTTILRVRGDGRVGIGKVSSLAAKLTVSSSNSASDLAVAHKIHHIGDSDTFIQFDDDEINIEVGGRQMIKFSEASTDKITLNNGGNDIDLQVKGSSNANLIRTDAANHRVGINTSGPDKPLEINGSDSDGGAIRLTYNDSDGSASDYADISVGANGALTFQTIDSDGVLGHMDFEADGDIKLDFGTGRTLELLENSTSILKLTSDSSDVNFQPQVSNKDITFSSQSGNKLMTLDSSDDAVKIDRRLGMGYDSITSSATLNANTPIVMIIAAMSDVTGTLADPSFAGQLKIVMGLNMGVGDSILSYKNPAGNTVSKTLINGTGMILCSFDATGGGALRWVPLGDISS